MRYEPEELSMLDTDTDDSWSDGFAAGKAEVLDMFLAEAITLAEQVLLPGGRVDRDVLDDLLALIGRWAGQSNT